MLPREMYFPKGKVIESQERLGVLSDKKGLYVLKRTVIGVLKKTVFKATKCDKMIEST